MLRAFPHFPTLLPDIYCRSPNPLIRCPDPYNSIKSPSPDPILFVHPLCPSSSPHPSTRPAVRSPSSDLRLSPSPSTPLHLSYPRSSQPPAAHPPRPIPFTPSILPAHTSSPHPQFPRPHPSPHPRSPLPTPALSLPSISFFTKIEFVHTNSFFFKNTYALSP